eukprot:1458033-Rhodomonas_salina.1
MPVAELDMGCDWSGTRGRPEALCVQERLGCLQGQVSGAKKGAREEMRQEKRQRTPWPGREIERYREVGRGKGRRAGDKLGTGPEEGVQSAQSQCMPEQPSSMDSSERRLES